MIEQIFAYIASNPRHRVSVGFKLPDGKIVRIHRKIMGDDRQRIAGAIDEVKAKGAKEIAVEIYRPNGSAEVLSKLFIIEVNQATPNALGSIPNDPPNLFSNPGAIVAPYLPPVKPTKPQPPKPMAMATEPQSWKDYALQTEQGKVAELKAELEKYKLKAEDLDHKVREFEKTMIQKDFEIQKLNALAEGKNGLNGVVDKITSSPPAMQTVANIINKLMGMPSMNQLPAGSPELEDSKPDQYVANIKNWIFKQPEPIQDKFYELVFQLTNMKDVPGTMEKILNLLKKPVPSSLDSEVQLNNVNI